MLQHILLVIRDFALTDELVEERLCEIIPAGSLQSIAGWREEDRIYHQGQPFYRNLTGEGGVDEEQRVGKHCTRFVRVWFYID